MLLQEGHRISLRIRIKYTPKRSYRFGVLLYPYSNFTMLRFQKCRLQTVNIQKRLFRTDGNKAPCIGRMHSGGYDKLRISAAQTFGWNHFIQEKPFSFRNQDAKILLFSVLHCIQSQNLVLREPASAQNPAIQSLLHKLDLPHWFMSPKNLVISFQKQHPLKHSMPKGVRYSFESVQAKADGNCIIHLLHLHLIQMPHVFPQASLVNGADLL